MLIQFLKNLKILKSLKIWIVYPNLHLNLQ